ncbi:MAG: hypothetical protein Q4D29_06855 [Lachnospiraceae bacterium]|nr:hypothetical protein [Lachnospiraceae bacterium]
MTATMNEYSRELTFEELANVYGGVGETQDEAIAESLLIAGMTLAAKLIVQTIMPDTFEEFYNTIKAHPVLVQSGITAVAGIPGVIAYNLLSSGTQKKFWNKVYDALK